MPDTGAPWNIPYADPTDLVRDWPVLSEDVADAVVAGLNVANTGIGTNLVTTTKTDVFSSSRTSGQAINVTGLSVTITPSSNTARILLLLDINLSGSGALLDRGIGVTLLRGSTAIGVGDAAGSRTRATAGGFQAPVWSASTPSINFLDSPGTAGAVTYNVRIINFDSATRTLYVNRTNGDDDFAYVGRYVSTITAIEVAP
jgi:hypothetical protein